MSDQIDAEPTLRRRPLPLLGALDRAVETVAVAAFIVMMLATLLQVAARYLHVAFDWTEELARILFLSSIMMGIALAIRRREHIVVDFLFANLTRRTQAGFSLAFDIAILGLLAIWLRGALRLMSLNVGTSFVTVPWFPVSLLYAIEAAAIALMMLFVAAEFVRQAQVLRGVGAER